MGRIVITIHGGSDLDAPIDPRFGRAERFLVADSESGALLDVVDNLSVHAAHGAGTGAAATIARLQADAVISGRFGPKAYEALRALGIPLYLAEGYASARAALEAFQAGSLPAMEMRVY